MKSCTVVLFDTGLPINIPDLRSVPSSVFPMWGDFHFLDFCLSNFSDVGPFRRLLVLEGGHREAQSFIHSKWKRDLFEVVQLSDGITEFMELLEADPSETIILNSTSFVGLFGADSLSKLLEGVEGSNIKIAIDGTPSDLYLVDKTVLIDLLKTYQNRIYASKGFSSSLFEEILHTSFDRIENIPGEILFQNSLMQLYRENLQVLNRQSHPACQEIFQRMSQLTSEGTPSYVGESAYIRRTFIASGVEIHGYVENSILFSGVLVKNRTKIINSVIMNNNQIGRNTVIQNAMILPYKREVKKGTNNIGNEVVIGGTSTTAKNSDYPNQINGGLTVVGLNAEIPRGTIIEQGCYVGVNVTDSSLRSLKRLRRGKSFIAE